MANRITCGWNRPEGPGRGASRGTSGGEIDGFARDEICDSARGEIGGCRPGAKSVAAGGMKSAAPARAEIGGSRPGRNLRLPAGAKSVAAGGTKSAAPAWDEISGSVEIASADGGAASLTRKPPAAVENRLSRCSRCWHAGRPWGYGRTVFKAARLSPSADESRGRSRNRSPMGARRVSAGHRFRTASS
jgi:hypothetical protein